MVATLTSKYGGSLLKLVSMAIVRAAKHILMLAPFDSSWVTVHHAASLCASYINYIICTNDTDWAVGRFLAWNTLHDYFISLFSHAHHWFSGGSTTYLVDLLHRQNSFQWPRFDLSFAVYLSLSHDPQYFLSLSLYCFLK